MKKLSLYVFLVLMWCNVGFADLIVYNKCNVTFAIWKDDTQLDEYINLEIRIDTNNKLINISKSSIIYKIWDIVNENGFFGVNIKNDEIYAHNRGRAYVLFPRLRAHLKYSQILVVNTTTNEIKRYGMNGIIPTDRINFPRDFYLIQEIICDERLDKK